MSGHLGQAVNAFVDGELDHTRRDEVLTHLACCSSCRAEVEALRGFKAALRHSGPPAVPLDLSARLMAVSSFPSSFPTAPVRVHTRRPLHPRLRRTAVGGAFVAIGLGGAMGLAGPPPRQPVAPVDPTNAGFVVDHVSTSYEVPLTETNVLPVAQPSP